MLTPVDRTDHYYRCHRCERWFGADYSDPHTGETLSDHEHGAVQLRLDLAVSS